MSPESITTIGSMDSGPALGAFRNDEERTDAKKPAVISDGRLLWCAASAAAVTPRNELSRREGALKTP
jgi:hypothetical protein